MPNSCQQSYFASYLYGFDGLKGQGLYIADWDYIACALDVQTVQDVHIFAEITAINSD